MSELLKFIHEDKLNLSSNEIASITGKRHNNVLRDCDNLNKSYDKLGLLRIEQGSYTLKATGDQQHRCFELNKLQVYDLMSGYNTELRIKIIRRWNELELSIVPSYQISDPIKRAEKWIEEQKQKTELLEIARVQEEKLINQEPRVQFADALLASKGSINIKDLSSVLQKNGFNNGKNTILAILRKEGYTLTKGEPSQYSLKLKLMETIFRNTKVSVLGSYSETYITAKGVKYFISKIDHFNSVVIQK